MREPAAPGSIFVGPWYSWWAGDPLPALPPVRGLVVAPADDDRALADLAGVDTGQIAAWWRAGNQAHLARLDGVVIACGWSVGARLAIGELRLDRPLPPGNRYLWGFVTAPEWRGRGVYPRLLQAVLRREARDTPRFWVGHTPDNTASARGILKAGFVRAGDVYRLPGGHLTLVPAGPLDRARAGADLLGASVRGTAPS